MECSLETREDSGFRGKQYGCDRAVHTEGKRAHVLKQPDLSAGARHGIYSLSVSYLEDAGGGRR